MAPARTVLSAPASSARILRRAASLAPGALMVDLEDGVAQAEKDAARATISKFRRLILSTASQLWLRVNPIRSDDWARDIEVIRAFGDQLDAVVVPKATMSVIALASEQIARPIVPLIESAAGVEESLAIARHSQVVGLLFGGLDYVFDLMMCGAVNVSNTDWVSARVVNAAAASGKWAISGPTSDLTDSTVLLDQAERERSVGFAGKLCIHPSQLPLVERAFAPSEVEIAWAERVLKGAAGVRAGAIAVGGEMIDRPVVERARYILGAANCGGSDALR